MPRFVNFGIQTPEIHATVSLLFLKSNRLQHVSIRKMAELLRCSLENNVNSRTRTRLFLSRVSILTRDTDIANLFVRPSVRPSVTFRYQMKTA